MLLTHELQTCRYSKIFVFCIAAIVGKDNGIIASMAAGSAIGVIVGAAGDLTGVSLGKSQVFC